MTISSITKMFSSDRTMPNGKINPSFQELQEYDDMATPPYREPYVDELDRHLPNEPYVDDHPPIKPARTILDMNKEELVEFAQGMYGLKLHRKMSPSNMVKAIYEFMNEPKTIGDLIKKESTSIPVPTPIKKKAGRPKGSKNKPKTDPLIDNI